MAILEKASGTERKRTCGQETDKLLKRPLVWCLAMACYACSSQLRHFTTARLLVSMLDPVAEQPPPLETHPPLEVASTSSAKEERHVKESSPPPPLETQPPLEVASTSSVKEEMITKAAIPAKADDDDPRPRGLRLVLMGDSVTRYQYMSLAYFLAHGKWWQISLDKKFNMVNKHTYGSHRQFYERFTNEIVAPYERCDCYGSEMDVLRFVDLFTDNRYFYDKERDNTLSFVGAQGHYGHLHGRYSPEEAFKNIGTRRYVHDDMIVTEEKQYKWFTYDWSWVVREHIAKLDPKPTHIVFNAGIWKHDFKNGDLRQQLRDAAKEVNMTSIWKTTSYLRHQGAYTSGARRTMSRQHRAKNEYRAALKKLGWPKIENETTAPKAVVKLAHINSEHEQMIRFSPLRRKKNRYKPGNETLGAEKLDPIMCELLDGCLDITWTNCVNGQHTDDGIHFNEPVYRIINEDMLEMIGHQFPSNYKKPVREQVLERNKSLCWVPPGQNVYNANVTRERTPFPTPSPLT